jgi:hypothetical protein
MVVSLSHAPELVALAISAWNRCPSQPVNGVTHFPFTHGLCCTVNSHKSVQGPRMAGRRALRREPILRSVVFACIHAAEARAAMIEIDQGHPKGGLLRPGHAEMIDHWL